jgi:ABC-type phosphate/phosphonate transport system permease subunit
MTFWSLVVAVGLVRPACGFASANVSPSPRNQVNGTHDSVSREDVISAATLCAANLTRGLPLLIWLRFVAKSVSFGLSRLRWRAQSSSRSILSTRLRPFISSVTHTPSRKYALRSSVGHASLGNSKPTVSQSSSNRRSSTCSWTRCVVVMSFLVD